MAGQAAEATRLASSWLGPPELDEVTTITADAVRAPTQADSPLSLDGLKLLPPDVAAGLAGHAGRILSLEGLTTLSDDSARPLARHEGPWLLKIDNVFRISPEAVAALRANADIGLPDRLQK